MEFVISGEIIQATTKCDKDFECLKNDDYVLCKVKRSISGEVIFVGGSKFKNCQYHIPFGEEIVCACPTRKEIFNKYGI